MKFCEREPNRRVYSGEVPEYIRQQCNKVECVALDGMKCECWMEFPSKEEQPYHDKRTKIVIDQRKDKAIDVNYYGWSAIIMGAAGIILFFVLWCVEVGIF